MKKITLFLLTILISCSAWAVNITSGTKLYLKPNSDWTQANARFAAYFFNGDKNSWVSMTKVSNVSSTIYEVTAPSGTWSNVIFCRMNSSSSANNWNNKWNQTGDLTFDGTKDLFTISQWDNQTSGWSKCFTLSYNIEDNYNVGDYYKPNAKCTNLTNPTFAYKVNGNSVDIPDEGYLFEQGGTFKFTIEAKGGSTTRATATHTITINPTVEFTNTNTEYTVGEYFKPKVSSTKIKDPTYSYKIDGNPIEISAEGYHFTKAGKFTFIVEVKHDNQGVVLADDEYTVTVRETAPAHVQFNNSPEDEYKVGTTFKPLVESENIENATYTYFVNDEETNISNGYTFLNAGTFVFRVEARSNGEGDVLADATHTITINSTVSLESKTEYSVGETYLPTVTSTGILNPTYSYSVEFDGNTTNITGNDYIFQDKGTYLFTVNALYNGNVIVSDTQEITIAPTVEITNASEVYYVGDTFTPEPSATSILKPTYSYKLNGVEIDLKNGYTFTEEDDYTLTVEVKNNGEGNVLATANITIPVSHAKVLYLKPGTNWKKDNARFAAYFFGNGDKWVDMTKLSDDLYVVDVPTSKSYPNVIFCRMDPSNTTNNWDNRWNQTGDLTIPTDNKNCFSVPNEAWNGSTTSWSEHIYTPSKLFISGDLENEIEVKDNAASTTMTSAFTVGTYNVVVNDGTRYWQNATSITIEETIPTIDIFVDANTKEITITPKNTFAEPSELIIGTEYSKLSYELTMPQNRWYWIVLPYNVNVSEIKTSTDGGWNDLVFTEYDAQHRANGDNGWINWKTEYTNEGKAVPTQLQANKGYVIGPKDGPYNQDGDFVVTFPSAEPTNTVKGSANLTTTEATGENEKDNNWHIIGTGLYHPTSTLDGVNYIAVPDNEGDYTYYYVNAPATDIFNTKFTNYTFNPFEAFFVQHGGEYSATAPDAQSAALAPVARAKAQEQEQIYLINMNEAHTVVILNAEGSEGYTAGEDFLEMNVGSRIEMIYSFDAEDALAFNHRTTEAQSIALGGYVAVAGEQTISLDAYNGNAEAVTLIDNVTGTTTDLLAEDYTFTTEVGSLDGRFTIVFAAQKAGSDTTVDCYNSIANQVIAYGTADHCTVSGLTAGEAIVVYNTMGQLVFATTADSETITLPSLTAGNYLILHNGTTNKVTLR